MDSFAVSHAGLPDIRPSSPPATPGPRSYPHFPSTASHTSPLYRRAGFYPSLSQSPPLDENIKPIGQGPNFLFSRLQAEDPSSRPSTASGFASAGSRRDASPEIDSLETRDPRPVVRRRLVHESDLSIEEFFGSERDLGSDVEILRPDPSDDSDSDNERPNTSNTNGHAGIEQSFQRLHCGDPEDDEEMRRYLRRKKRWSGRLFKRSHSQSIGSDTDGDDSDALDAHDVGSSARRLRRRVRGPGQRASLIFDEYPRQHILEVEEPDEEFADVLPSPLDLNASEQMLEAMPFWRLEDPMEIDTDSEHSAED